MIKFKSIFKYFIIMLLIAGSLSIIKANDVYAYEDEDPYNSISNGAINPGIKK